MKSGLYGLWVVPKNRIIFLLNNSLLPLLPGVRLLLSKKFDFLGLPTRPYRPDFILEHLQLFTKDMKPQRFQYEKVSLNVLQQNSKLEYDIDICYLREKGDSFQACLLMLFLFQKKTALFFWEIIDIKREEKNTY